MKKNMQLLEKVKVGFSLLPFNTADTASITLILRILSTELFLKKYLTFTLQSITADRVGNLSIFPFQYYSNNGKK